MPPLDVSQVRRLCATLSDLRTEGNGTLLWVTEGRVSLTTYIISPDNLVAICAYMVFLSQPSGYGQLAWS